MNRQRHWRSILATVSLLIGGQLSAVPLFSALAPQPVEAADLERIRQRGWLLVGVLECLPPLACRNAAGEWQGFEVDLARQLAKDLLGAENAVRFTPLRTTQRLEAVIEGQVDLAIAQVGITPSRQRVVRFSPPYYFDATGLLAAPVTRLPDRPSVAVLQGSRSLETLRASALPFALVPVPDYATARQQLESAQVQAIAADVTVLVGWQQAHPAWTLLPQRLGIVTAKGRESDALATVIDRTVRRWQASGQLQTWARRWGLP
jgi:polar amino acid transport system substrate-binding protein